MKVTISFKHLEHTEALDSRIREKSKKLEKYFSGNTQIEWTCYIKEGVHYADAKVVGPRFNYKATAHSDGLYKCLDKIVDKLEKQLHKKKEMWKDKIHHKHELKVQILDPEQAWFDHEDDELADDVNYDHVRYG